MIKHLLTLSSLIFCSTLFPVLAQDLVINEFLSSNVTDFPEMYDFGDYNDWIEIHNPGSTPVSLDHVFLSDNSGQPLKWKFPSGTTLEAGAYLLVWADGYNEGPGAVYQRPAWPWDNFTTRHYHSNFKLDKEGEQLILSRAGSESLQMLIATGSVWHYLDLGTPPPVAWIDPGFDASSWSHGAAPLGYGDGDESTVVSYGPDGNNKFTTTYFRHAFQISNPTGFQQLALRLQRDDGAVIYLNGTEILRSNMPDGDIDDYTFATSAVGGADEDTYFEFEVDAEALITGENVLAVEIHQISPSSSDISFDLELTAISYAQIEIVDQIDFSQQITDVSLGRTAAGSFQFFGEPTPGSPNITAGTLSESISPQVSVSQNGGFQTGPITLELSSSHPDGIIYYTLDGSRPGSASNVYTSPILLSETSILKARCFVEGQLPGPILVESYFFNEASTLPIVSLIAEPPTLWDSDIGIYTNEYKQREIPVSIQYFSELSQPDFNIRAGARLGGQNIWTKPQKPFTIYMRGRYGDDMIHYQLFPSKQITNFTRIVFRNGGDDWEETLIRDPMAESLMQGRMDCGYMSYQPTLLFLNGDYWGIHNIREKFDAGYFYENFGVTPDAIDHLEYASTPGGTQLLVVEGDLTRYEDLLNFVQSSDLNQTQHYETLKSMMNVDGFIDHLTMTLFVANTSWGHNREWWRARTDTARWEWLVVDLDRGLNPVNINNNLLDNLLNDYQLLHLLQTSNPFMERFIQRAAAHINNTFSYARLEMIVDSLSQVVRAEIPRHAERWGSVGGVSSLTGWENALNDIKTFAQARPNALMQHFVTTLGLPQPIELSLDVSPAVSGKITAHDVPVELPHASRPYFQGVPLRLTAIPEPGYQFSHWSTGDTSQSIIFDCQTAGNITAHFTPNDDLLLPHVLSSNTTLTSGQSYAAAQDLLVPEGLTLTLEPGVIIKFSTQADLIVEGQLEINGTEAHPVEFRSNPQSGSSSWGGVSFVSSADTSHLRHLIVRNATRGNDPLLFPAAISAYNAHLYLESIDIRDCEAPIFVQGGSLDLQSSTLSAAVTCDLVNVKRGAATIGFNRFLGSGAYDTDAIDLDGVHDGLIHHNWIYHFSGENSDAIDIGEEAQNISITENRIYHILDKGISVGQKSTVTAQRNLFLSCGKGIAVKDSSFATVLNNTFFQNDIAVACYVKNEGRGGGEAEIVNSIFSESSTQDLFSDALSQISIRYSLSDGALHTGMGNLQDDPLFNAPTLYDLSLQAGSPCIDAGDPDSGQDEDGSVVDMGAYYDYLPADYPFEITGQTLRALKINEILADNVSSNSDETGEFDDWVEFYNPTSDTLDLAGCFLTDDPNNLAKWQFPENSAPIFPQGFLLVWCDDDTEQGALHSNFKLAAGGEMLALTLPDGHTVIDSVFFGVQTEDISLGRALDGGDDWVLGTPTPGVSNQTAPVEADQPLPRAYQLHANYPNPFNASTLIEFDIPRTSSVELDVFDLRGRLVIRLIRGERPAGSYSITWSGKTENGLPVATGVYLLRLQAESFSQTRKLVILK